jgi:hypothetical protein
MIMCHAGFGLENDCAGEDQQQLKIIDPSSHQRGWMLHKDYNRKCSVEKIKHWSCVSRGFAPRRNDWPYTASRKVTLNEN